MRKGRRDVLLEAVHTAWAGRHLIFPRSHESRVRSHESRVPRLEFGSPLVNYLALRFAWSHRRGAYANFSLLKLTRSIMSHFCLPRALSLSDYADATHLELSASPITPVRLTSSYRRRCLQELSAKPQGRVVLGENECLAKEIAKAISKEVLRMLWVN
jgi:hypothetical protein